MSTPYLVRDLLEDYDQPSLTIHGAWSHRHGCNPAWADIVKAGLPTYIRALEVVVLHSNDPGAFRQVAEQMFRIEASQSSSTGE